MFMELYLDMVKTHQISRNILYGIKTHFTVLRHFLFNRNQNILYGMKTYFIALLYFLFYWESKHTLSIKSTSNPYKHYTE